MASTDTATIDSLGKASRHLSSLASLVGFDEAVRRIESHSSAEIAGRLRHFAGWVGGRATESPDPELELLGTVVRHAPGGGDAGKAIGAADAALADARALADHVRSGLVGSIAYMGVLIAVAAVVALTWLTGIAPRFAGMYSLFSSPLPWLSGLFVDSPWILLLALGVPAFLLLAVVAATRHLAARVATVAALEPGIRTRTLGAGVRAAHARWRALTVARAWAAGGADPLAAMQQATGVLGTRPGLSRELTAELALAAELGTGQGELGHLTQAGFAGLRGSIETWQAIVVRSLQVAVAVVVGLIIVAIYLPIFSMGAMI